MFSRATTPGPVGNPEPRTVTETPHLSRLGLYTLQSGVGLEDKRSVVCEEAGRSVRLVTVDYFLKAVAPRLRPEINVDVVLQKLRDHGDIVGDRWAHFLSDPGESHEHENVTFKPLEKLIQTIVDATKCGSVLPTLKLVNNPYACPESSLRNNSSRPDSYAILTLDRSGSQDRPLWIDIGGTGEYKKGDTEKDKVDNARKIMWSMHHCMANDPRRRFTFGWTIENTEMRLWHCNRSKRLVTCAFNFVEEHKYLVHFFLSLICADPYEIGWDPTMVIVDAKKGKEVQYDITVRSEDGEHRVYRTLKMLSNIGAEAVQGRGTRVWLVVRNINGRLGSEQVVLKDSWIDHDRMREGRILQEIIGASKSMPIAHLVRGMFLSVESHGDVLVEGRLDHTRELIMRGHHLLTVGPRYSLERATTISTGARHLLARNGMAGDVGLTIRRAVTQREPPDFDDKVHYRIVFKEQCKQIREQTSVSKIFANLSQIVGDEQGIAKLADLEYAKRMDDTKSHRVRTGSDDFKAAELDTHRYHFYRTPGPSVDRIYSHVNDLIEAAFTGKTLPKSSSSAKQKQTTPTKLGVAFWHNPLHDMESIWWSATHMIAGNEALSGSTEYSGLIDDDVASRAQKQRKLAEELSNDRHKRNAIILGNPLLFHEILESLHPRMHDVARTLEDLRLALVRAYQNAELNPGSIDNNVSEELYAKFLGSFLEISEGLKVDDIWLRPFAESVESADADGAVVRRTTVTAKISSAKKRKRQSTEGSGFLKQRKRRRLADGPPEPFPQLGCEYWTGPS
ncbi:hypothetical protein EW026_g8162 [Hermanssonia centrifuga]|uniref:Fungal-type protein kinase domain-containing protein n=1 Tax=Hermanssonia centrifuga TaxID=98765 RepID=A0A4S4K592_9APHY|nr:hypothetical protein EW026_g8162 [Hermanssonia centrifuga]